MSTLTSLAAQYSGSAKSNNIWRTAVDEVDTLMS